MPASTLLTRRTLLRSTGALAGAALVRRYAPDLAPALRAAQAPAASSAKAGADALEMRRAELAKVPIVRTRLTDRLELLAGPGGNVLVLHGPDGLLLVDNFVRPAWPQLKSTLDAIGGPVKTAIDTHWHFDHADNNANLHRAGAVIVAHARTKVRLSEPHDILGMHMDPEPAEALPAETFTDARTVNANGDTLTLQYVPPAHTDTDISARFAKANVLHLGDLFFNGTYPFIDASTRGNVNGMISASDRALQMVDDKTKIVPGHGPLGDRIALRRYRTMLATIRDRIRAQKAKGATLEQVQAAKPTAEFDAQWGKGMMGPNAFVALVYAGV
jgi:cyclase